MKDIRVFFNIVGNCHLKHDLLTSYVYDGIMVMLCSFGYVPFMELLLLRTTDLSSGLLSNSAGSCGILL